MTVYFFLLQLALLIINNIFQKAFLLNHFSKTFYSSSLCSSYFFSYFLYFCPSCLSSFDNVLSPVLAFLFLFFFFVIRRLSEYFKVLLLDLLSYIGIRNFLFHSVLVLSHDIYLICCEINHHLSRFHLLIIETSSISCGIISPDRFSSLLFLMIFISFVVKQTIISVLVKFFFTFSHDTYLICCEINHHLYHFHLLIIETSSISCGIISSNRFSSSFVMTFISFFVKQTIISVSGKFFFTSSHDIYLICCEINHHFCLFFLVVLEISSISCGIISSDRFSSLLFVMTFISFVVKQTIISVSGKFFFTFSHDFYLICCEISIIPILEFSRYHPFLVE